MDAALEDVTKNKPEPTAGQKAAEELVRRAREQGLSLDSRGTSLRGVRVRKLVTTPRIATARREGHHWILGIRPARAGSGRCALNVPPSRGAGSAG
jgi:hypothetical protein